MGLPPEVLKELLQCSLRDLSQLDGLMEIALLSRSYSTPIV